MRTSDAVVLAVICCSAGPAWAQDCSTSNSVKTCDEPAGTYSAPLWVLNDSITPPNSYVVTNEGTLSVGGGNEWGVEIGAIPMNAGLSAPTLSFTNSGSISLTGPTLASGYQAVRVLSLGGDGNNGQAGGAAGSVNATTTGPVSLSFSGVALAPQSYALFARSAGGAGGGPTGSGHDSAPGGGAGNVSVTVANTIVSVTTIGSASPVAAIGAFQEGGAGGDSASEFSATDNAAGGAGGATGTMNVSLTNATVTASGGAAGGIVVSQTGGTGGWGGNWRQGGLGGATGPLNLTLNGATISASGATAVLVQQAGGAGGNASTGNSSTHSVGGAGGATAVLNAQIIDSAIAGGNGGGLVLEQTGGSGGSGNNKTGPDGDDYSYGFTGGSAGGITLILKQNVTGSVVSTRGGNAAGILAQSEGGAGGAGAGFDNLGSSEGAGNGGNGGNADGAVLVQSAGTLTITTTGASSPGLAAIGQSGAGGNANGANCGSANCYGGAGGAGGNSGAVEVDLGSGASVETKGTTSAAVEAESLGADGGYAGGVSVGIGNADGASSGAGGAAGPVSVDLTGGITLTTDGAGSPGLLAESIGGAGGSSPSWEEVHVGTAGDGHGSNGGAGGNAAGATATSGATITTSGDESPGILVQVLGGPGGAGGPADSALTGHSDAGAGGASGEIVGPTSVSNSGKITTSGSDASGMLVQAIGGSGGVAGSAENLFYVSTPTDEAGANGGVITVTNSGAISTAGDSAMDIVAQSIGGGGGVGGSNQSMFYSHGADGGNGGNGESVTVNLNSGGNLSADGSLADGVLAQSVGGSGGTGGNISTTGAGVNYVVGGSGGNGGSGGTAEVDANGTTINSRGTGASGIVAQSVGGGGGAGGAAYSFTAGAGFAFAGAVGGAGGGGGAGGDVTVTTANTTINTGNAAPGATSLPVNAIGLIAQSVGGGGGVGGGASAAAVAASIKLPTTSAAGAITATYSAGGAGGSGGDASAVNVTLGGGTAITTAGAGSTGVVTQSIGGGGGVGGDSSVLNAVIGMGNKYYSGAASTQTLNVGVTVGGGGGGGGSAGTASLTLGDSSGGAKVATSDDSADGVLLQSIGGGGGDAGSGSTAFHEVGNTGTINLDVGVALGASGGNGGSGSTVTFTEGASSSITTSGSSSPGVVAQSIGGGGGQSSGGTFGFSGLSVGPKYVHLTVAPTVSIGTTGGGGGNGECASAIIGGRVVTLGDDAPGVLVQSIGGGGGVGGSAGADASSAGDGAEDPAPGPRAADDDSGPISAGSFTLALTPTINLGGTGGSGGSGGGVSVTTSGTVQTSGDYAPGIVAQSIGGGGGRGGVAVTDTQFPSLRSIVASLSLDTLTVVGANGGSGSGGFGSSVEVSLNGGTIATGAGAAGSTGTGFQSFGVLAQSVGAGGGIVSDGTTGPNGTVLLGAGSNGAFGNSATVTVNQTGSGATTISTSGDYADGIVAQSIGGGGGVYGGGSAAPVSNEFYDANVAVALGAQTSASGHADAQPVDIGTGSTPMNVVIRTTGDDAYGILAQSISGGGGLAAVGGAATVTELGRVGGNDTTEDGGPVTMVLGPGGSITTSGLRAHGIVAQSVGGGGGLAVFQSSGSAPVITTVAPSSWTASSDDNEQGGNVTVTTNAPITVTGGGAFGILAQSIGAGGGLATTPSGAIFAGSTGGAHGGAGTVTVTTAADIAATGTNGVAVFAESAASAPSAITVNLKSGPSGVTAVTGGSISGGGQGNQDSGGGYGVWIIGGIGSDQLNIGGGVTLSALSGVAINSTGAALSVTNNGTLGGSAYLSGGTITNGGTLAVAGPTMPGASAPYYGTATLDGNLVQAASGKVAMDVDFAARAAGKLVVTGDARLAGTIVPHPATILPNVRLPVMIVDGTMTGSIEGARSALFRYTAEDPPEEITLGAEATGFAPAGFGIRGAASEVASYLGPVFDTSTTAEQGRLFAALDALADENPGAYVNALEQLSPGSVLAFASRARAQTMDFADSLFDCRDLEATRSAVSKTGCAWMELRGGVASQGTDGGYAPFTESSLDYRIGGQAEFAPGWLVGGAIGYAHSWLDGNAYTKGDGDAATFGVSLTRAWRGFRFSGALVGGFGANTTTRSVLIPGFTSALRGSPDVDSEAALLRADYTWGFGDAYVRPSMTIGVVRVHAASFNESGEHMVGLDFGASTVTSGVFAPAVEFGLRTPLKNGAALRSYIRLGASVPTTSMFHQPVRFAGAAPAAGGFDAGLPTDGAAATVGLGVDLYTAGPLDLRMAYGGSFSGRVIDNTGMLTGRIHF